PPTIALSTPAQVPGLDPGTWPLNKYAGFYRLREAIFAKNLAAGAKLKASNVRGQSLVFRPANLLDGNPDTYWATDDAVHAPELIVDFGQNIRCNVFRLREAIQLGQRIGAFAVDAWQQGAWAQVAGATSIGSCRLIRLPAVIETPRLRLRITSSPVCIALADFGVFLDA
ncbi:MAG: discoidin domain-containing protein, partial [Terracidiphilus sp.]